MGQIQGQIQGLGIFSGDRIRSSKSNFIFPSLDPGALEEFAPKKLHLHDCGTRLVMSAEKNTTYLVPSNTDYFYEISCIAKGDDCSLQTTKKWELKKHKA